MNPIYTTILRSILKIGGGALTTNGLLDSGSTETLIGAITAIAGIVWGIWEKRKKPAPIPLKTPAALLLALAILPGCASYKGLVPGKDAHIKNFKANLTTPWGHTEVSAEEIDTRVADGTPAPLP